MEVTSSPKGKKFLVEVQQKGSSNNTFNTFQNE